MLNFSEFPSFRIGYRVQNENPETPETFKYLKNLNFSCEAIQDSTKIAIEIFIICHLTLIKIYKNFKNPNSKTIQFNQFSSIAMPRDLHCFPLKVFLFRFNFLEIFHQKNQFWIMKIASHSFICHWNEVF